jgi:hypothetical protein
VLEQAQQRFPYNPLGGWEGGRCRTHGCHGSECCGDGGKDELRLHDDLFISQHESGVNNYFRCPIFVGSVIVAE